MDRKIFKFQMHFAGCPTNGCWIWQGDKNDKGYGITADGKLVHRITTLNDPNKRGWYNGTWYHREVHHKCMRKDCVNPLHLVNVSRTAHFKRHKKVGFKSAGLPVDVLIFELEPNEYDFKFDNFYCKIVIPLNPMCLCQSCVRRRHREKRREKKV